MTNSRIENFEQQAVGTKIHRLREWNQRNSEGGIGGAPKSVSEHTTAEREKDGNGCWWLVLA